MKSLLQWLYFPAMVLLGMGGTIALVGAGAPYWQPALLLLGLVGLSFGVERAIPYNAQWNRSHGDARTDLIHALVNTALNHAGILLLPLLAGAGVLGDRWPRGWPFWLQVVAAILVLDLGIAAAHHASHKWGWLWRFHAVHHSARRLYGLNGLMKHPVHQAVETASGVLPLLLLGIPQSVAAALVFCVAIQLLLQHSNADCRTGPLRYVFANAQVHRLHHRSAAGLGDVNFGLFTTLWDHCAGTYCGALDAAPRTAEELGVAGRAEYPRGYWGQMGAPFGRG